MDENCFLQVVFHTFVGMNFKTRFRPGGEENERAYKGNSDWKLQDWRWQSSGNPVYITNTKT